MIRKLLKSSAIYGIAPSVPKIVGILILPLITKYLTDVDYGIAGTIMAYTSALAAFSTLGFNVCLQVSFFRSKGQYKILWRQIYGFLQIWMLVFAIIQGTILYFIIPEEASDNKWLLILLTNFNGVLYGPAGFIGVYYYQYMQKPIPIAFRSVLAGLLTVFINYLLIVKCQLGYIGWYVSSFAATFLLNISYWYDLNYKVGISPIYNFKIRTIIRQLKVALPTIPHYYSVFLINTSNRLVMDWANIGLGPIGQYNFIHQFSTYIETGTLAVERAAAPMCMNAISRLHKQEEKRIVYIFAVITLVFTFLISLWCKQIFGIMVKNEVLSTTYIYAVFLIMALNYRPMYFAVSNIYFYNEKTKQILLITFLAGIVAFVLNVIFIPVYGIWAAVIINYIIFLYQGFSGFYMPTFKKLALNTYPFQFLFVLEIILTTICIVCQEYDSLFKLIISIIFLLLSSVYLIRTLKTDEKYH